LHVGNQHIKLDFLSPIETGHQICHQLPELRDPEKKIGIYSSCALSYKCLSRHILRYLQLIHFGQFNLPHHCFANDMLQKQITLSMPTTSCTMLPSKFFPLIQTNDYPNTGPKKAIHTTGMRAQWLLRHIFLLRQHSTRKREFLQPLALFLQSLILLRLARYLLNFLLRHPCANSNPTINNNHTID
jgi:hypothetical protein